MKKVLILVVVFLTLAEARRNNSDTLSLRDAITSKHQGLFLTTSETRRDMHLKHTFNHEIRTIQKKGAANVMIHESNARAPHGLCEPCGKA